MYRLLAVGSAVAILLAGCGFGGDDEPADKAATVAFTPANNATGVKPDDKITATVRDGTLDKVEATDEDGEKLPGDVNAEKTGWTATERLAPGTDYTIKVTATGAKGAVTSTAKFSTLRVPASRQLKPSSISPLNGSTVGVGQPLVVGFNHQVKDRVAVQRALSVTTTPKVDGAWYWIDDDHVHYRPAEFWPAGTKVTLNADLTGVNAGNGYWGARSRTVSFTTGRAQVVRIDVKRLRMTVQQNGKVTKTFPVTSGKPGWETRNGTKVLMEKVTNKTWTNDEIDAPEEYTLKSAYAMRMTNSGEFVHDAPWSTANLGQRSASHGCVGMRPADAAWLYRSAMVGDPIIVSGSPRVYGPIWNRYGDWNVPWAVWSAGNAGPGGKPAPDASPTASPSESPSESPSASPSESPTDPGGSDSPSPSSS